jgi:hypothetical protein
MHGATFAMPIDQEMLRFFADRGSLVATSTKDGPAPYASKVWVADPARGPWRAVYSADAMFNEPTLADGFLSLFEYREQGGGAYSEKLVVVDLPAGGTQVVDSYALSAATYHGGGGGPPRPSGSAVMGGGLIAWVRLVEGSAGSVTGELRVGLPHLPSQAKLVARSDTWLRPVSVDAFTLVYRIASGNAAELRARDLATGAERVLAKGQISETGASLPFDPIARSGAWVGWIEEASSSGGGTSLRAVNVATGAARELSLGGRYCPVLTGNDRYFAVNCSGSATAQPQMVLVESASLTQVAVAPTSSDGPYSLEAAGFAGQLLWQDRVAGTRRIVLFTPTRAIDPAAAAASPAPTLVSFENVALGYRIGLPAQYRRSLSVVQPDGSGRDFYSPRSEEADRALCQRERGSDIPSFEREFDLHVSASPNAAGLTALDYASAPARRISFSAIESLTIDGHDAVRVVQVPSGDTAYYVVGANDRLYEIAPFAFSQPSHGNAGGAGEPPPVGWLDQIALSFRAIAVEPPTGPLATDRPLCGP